MSRHPRSLTHPRARLRPRLARAALAAATAAALVASPVTAQPAKPQPGPIGIVDPGPAYAEIVV